MNEIIIHFDQNKKMMINVGKMKILKNNIINEFEIKYGK